MKSSVIIKKLEDQRNMRLQGGYNSIPFDIPVFDKYLYGINRGFYYITSAASGVGKTQFTKAAFVYNVHAFCKKHNIPLNIFYFALEENEETFKLTTFTKLLKLRFGIDMDYANLQSLGEHTLDEHTLIKIKELEQEVDELHENVYVIDTISDPDEMYSYIVDKLRPQGELKVFEDNGETISKFIYDDPTCFNIVITDHISLLSNPDSLWNRMTLWSKEHCLGSLKRVYNCTIINVQQQSAEKDKAQFTMQGKPIVSKLVPSMDGLADNKTTYRDADVVIGLFNPAKHQIEVMNGFHVGKLKGHYLSGHIVKNRYGRDSLIADLWFDGAANRFEGIPRSLSESEYQELGKGNFIFRPEPKGNWVEIQKGPQSLV